MRCVLQRAKFEVLGGVIYEHTAFKSGVVGTDGVVVSLMNAAGAIHSKPMLKTLSDATLFWKEYVGRYRQSHNYGNISCVE